jgi:thiamine pyrophosphokinase
MGLSMKIGDLDSISSKTAKAIIVQMMTNRIIIIANVTIYKYGILLAKWKAQ